MDPEVTLPFDRALPGVARVELPLIGFPLAVSDWRNEFESVGALANSGALGATSELPVLGGASVVIVVPICVIAAPLPILCIAISESLLPGCCWKPSGARLLPAEGWTGPNE